MNNRYVNAPQYYLTYTYIVLFSYNNAELLA
jgi:hypothetical protein